MSTAPDNTPRVCIAGIGSPHGSDSAGWLSVQRLQQDGFAGRFPPGEVVLAVCATPAQLLTVAEGARLLLVVDALCSNDPPGTLHCLTAAELAQWSLPASSHALGVAPMLELIDALQGGRTQMVLFGIGVGPLPDEHAHVDVPALVEAILTPLAAAIEDHVRRAFRPAEKSGFRSRPGGEGC